MKEWLRSLNPVIAGTALILLLIGLFCLQSISPGGSSGLGSLVSKQALFALLGVSAMAALSMIHFSRVERVAYHLYAAGVFLLIVLLLFTRPVRGVRAWFTLGPFTLQPSEFVKIMLVVALARFVSRVGEWRIRDVAAVLVLAALPIGLVVVQPDLGMCIVMSFSVLAVMVAGRVPWRVLGALLGLAVVAMPILFAVGLKEYQRQRILALVVPDKAARGMRDQQDQALRLFGSGMWTGKGFGEASLAPPYYLPERHNDFILSVVGEEMGFLGTALVLVLYGGMLLVCLRVASRHRDPFPRVAMVGMISLFYMQIVSNIGMTLGLLPVTGLTLPFLSYGGSSLLASFSIVGIMLGIAGHWKPVFSARELPEHTYELRLPCMR
jgi:rod shape determining protein RodA